MKKILDKFYYYQKVYIFKISLEKYEKDFKPEVSLWTGPGTIDDIYDLHKDKTMDLDQYDWNYLKNKSETKEWLNIIVKKKNNILGYSFYSTRTMWVTGTKIINFKLPPLSAYFFKLFVSPAARNMSIGKYLTNYRLHMLKQAGVTDVYSAVNSTNHIQIHNSEKVGWKRIGSIHFLKTKLFNRYWISRNVHRSKLELI